MRGKASLAAIGDLILSRQQPYLFRFIGPVLRQHEFTVAHLEVVYTARHPEAVRLGRTPDALEPLVEAGIKLVTLAGNHVMDYGPEGIEDTVRWLDERGIAHAGAGRHLEEARRPAILEHGGYRVAVLSYNCVGPKETWARHNRPGCAYVRIITHYELDHATPGGPPEVFTWAEPRTLQQMCDDIQRLRPQCDLVVVALHKGIGHVPVVLADYELQVAHAAVDAGADVVLGHHAHILKGIEVYRGKVIFHGLGNGAVYLPEDAFDSGSLPEDWGRRRRQLFGFEPDPRYPTYPFHPDARYAMIARVILADGGLSAAGFVPCLVMPDGIPRPVGNDDAGREVFRYVQRVTEEAGLSTTLRFRDGCAWVE